VDLLSAAGVKDTTKMTVTTLKKMRLMVILKSLKENTRINPPTLPRKKKAL